MQKAIFPMSNMNITQGMNGGFSHKGVLALDLAGRDTGIENVFAPFTGVVKRKWANGNVIWLESITPVKYANGVEDFMTIMLMHDNDTTNLYVGQVINQLQVFYQEGTSGYATGNHVHLQVARGKFTGSGWFQNSFKKWCLNNQINVNDGLYTYNTNIINGGGLNWVKTTDLNYEVPKPITQKVYLPKTATTWRVYPLNKAPVKGNECGILTPKEYGGLVYDILGYTQPNVAIIQTKMYGKVQIYVGTDTSAKIK
jgi:murein DD-endopeptidase MepM/ murein hydrolase activator NlpD